MDERFVKKFVVPCSILFALTAIFFYEAKYIIDYFFFKKKHILIIGILSAPENFQQRLSIRKTWLQLLSEIPGSSYFIIGNEICDVPPSDRPDLYSCVSYPFILPRNFSQETEFSVISLPKNKTDLSVIPNFLGFGFFVRSKIVVRKLGVLKNILTVFKSEIHVKLLSSFSNRILASVTFEPISENSTGEVAIKAIKPVILDEQAEAFIRLESNEFKDILLPDCKFSSWNDGPRVITLISLWPIDKITPKPFIKQSCSYVFMTYSIVDADHFEKSVKDRHSRLKQWHLHNKKLSLQLSNESKIYNDIMLVDVIDVYRNLSLKMVHFFRRLVDTEYFRYILKTDDDSFVDLIRVSYQLKMLESELEKDTGVSLPKNKEVDAIKRNKALKFWWWSCFREYWKVQKSGKWRDLKYDSASYPSFPCGGGYVVNKAVVEYITVNEENLEFFQGEDVSMGIWLSPLQITYHVTPRVILNNTKNKLQTKIFRKLRGKYLRMIKIERKPDFAPDLCEWTCNNEKNVLPLCNRIQLSIDKMFSTWDEYMSNGYL